MVAILVPLLCSAVLGLFIATTYHFTKEGISHSQSFIRNLVMLTVVTCTVMLVIGDNIARAFSLVGALSIIRFRTPLKDPLDIGFVFYALVIGMAIGTKSYEIGFIASIVISTLFISVHKLKFGSSQKIDFLVKLVKTHDLEEPELEAVMHKYLSEVTLVNMIKPGNNDEMEITYMVLFKKNLPESREAFIKEIEKLHGLQRIIMLNKAIDIEN